MAEGCVIAEIEKLALDQFSIIKGIAFALFFFAAVLIQFWRPHQNERRSIYQNWRVNLPLGLLNSVLVGWWCGNCVCQWAENATRTGVNLFGWLDFATSFTVLASIALLDLVAYAVHRLYHEIGIFWRLHQVHHSDEVFETSTAIRFHPGEIVVSLALRLFVVVCFGVPVVALLLFEMIYLFFVLIEHSDFQLSGPVEKLLSPFFITPAMHRLHHSVQTHEMNSNYGTIFSVWDRLFRSYQSTQASRKVDVGLGRPSGGLSDVLWRPLKKR